MSALVPFLSRVSCALGVPTLSSVYLPSDMGLDNFQASQPLGLWPLRSSAIYGLYAWTSCEMGGS